MSFLGGILAILVALAGLFGCGALSALQGGDVMPISPVEPPMPINPSQGEPTFRSDVMVTDVAVTVDMGGGPEIILDITGYTDGCQYPVITEVSQDNTTITVQLYRDLPLAVACPDIALDYNGTVSINTVEEGNTYTIYVNGFMTQVEL